MMPSVQIPMGLLGGWEPLGLIGGPRPWCFCRVSLPQATLAFHVVRKKLQAEVTQQLLLFSNYCLLPSLLENDVLELTACAHTRENKEIRAGTPPRCFTELTARGPWHRRPECKLWRFCGEASLSSVRCNYWNVSNLINFIVCNFQPNKLYF